MPFAVTKMAQWLEHSTLGNLLALGFLGCAFDTTKQRRYFFLIICLKNSKLNIVRNCALQACIKTLSSRSILLKKKMKLKLTIK